MQTKKDMEQNLNPVQEAKIPTKRENNRKQRKHEGQKSKLTVTDNTNGPTILLLYSQFRTK